jgi:hypothetical protein
LTVKTSTPSIALPRSGLGYGSPGGFAGCSNSEDAALVFSKFSAITVLAHRRYDGPARIFRWACPRKIAGLSGSNEYKFPVSWQMNLTEKLSEKRG